MAGCRRTASLNLEAGIRQNLAFVAKGLGVLPALSYVWAGIAASPEATDLAFVTVPRGRIDRRDKAKWGSSLSTVTPTGCVFEWTGSPGMAGSGMVL